MCLSQSVFFFHEAPRSLVFFKGKEVSVKAPIKLFVFINFAAEAGQKAKKGHQENYAKTMMSYI